MAFRNVNSAHLFASERSPEQLSKAQMSTFSLLALSAPDCYDLQQKPPKHAHSSPRQPQLRRLTDLCSHRQALGHPYAKAAKWSAGQVQSTLQFTCCFESLVTEQVSAKQSWFCLCCRAVGSTPTIDSRMVRCLPDCQPRTSCAKQMLRR